MYKDNKGCEVVWLLPSQMCGSYRSWQAPQRTSPLWRSCRWSPEVATRWRTQPRWAQPPARCRTLQTLREDQPDEMGFCSHQGCISRYLESKLSRIVVHATAVHEAEHVLDSFVGKNPLPCDRTYASVCQGACHHGHALAVHLQAAGLWEEIVFLIMFILKRMPGSRSRGCSWCRHHRQRCSLHWGSNPAPSWSRPRRCFCLRCPWTPSFYSFSWILLPLWEEGWVLETHILSSSHPDWDEK